jgi:inner membrane protein
VDNLTHSLTGVLLSRAGLNRMHKQSVWILFLSANIPDVDVVSALGGTANYFHYHRWITHAIAMAPVMAVIPLLVVWLFTRKAFDWKLGYLLSLIGIASHLMLDSTNEYGVRLLLPFSDAWIGLSITSVIDVWIWAALLIGIIAPALSALVSSEIGAKQGRGRGAAIFALSLVLFYDGSRFFLRQRAIAEQETRLYEDSAPRRVTALPNRLNPFAWKGVVETDRAFYVQRMNLTSNFDPTRGRVYYKPEPLPVMDIARKEQVFVDLLRFSPFVLWRVSPSDDFPGSTQVDAIDLRFSSPPPPNFYARAVVDSGGRVVRTRYHF